MSEIKVNKISPRTNCGTTQLGDSGDTITIPAGATITNSGTASGFGATGAVSWNTTVKTSTFTAVAGEGYFVNTTGGAVTVNLPAGTAGAVVGIKDYAGTFDTNKVTVAPNGSDKIAGDNTTDATLTTEGIAITFVFIDSTQGWLVTDSGLQSELPTASFITASGGAISTCGNFKTHVFTGPGTFTVCSVGNAAGSNTIDYLVVGGGGGGGRGGSPAYMGGAGGAGGFRVSNSVGCVPAPTMSPLANPTGLPVTATGYPVTVGAGGATAASDNNKGVNGVNSVFAGSSTITSAGGGFGAAGGGTPESGGPGGSGGGSTQGQAAGTGNIPSVSPPQGQNGGQGQPGNNNGGGGGGGAGAAGSNAPGPNVGGAGGDGGFVAETFFSGGAAPLGTPGPVSNTRYFSGGGAGSSDGPQVGSINGATGGAGGGGNGGTGGNPGGAQGRNGTANTGGGGGGGSGCCSGSPSPLPGGNGGEGGSGIVVIRYKFQ